MGYQLGTTKYEFDIPTSFCGVWDVFYMISTNPNRAQLGRLFAAIIGLTIQGARCPKYSLADADPIQYGGKMQRMATSQEYISRGSSDNGFPSVLVSIGTHSHKGGSRTGREFLISPSGGIVRTGFTISRFWGRDPDWFFRQPKQLQAELIADYNCEPIQKGTHRQTEKKI